MRPIQRLMFIQTLKAVKGEGQYKGQVKTERIKCVIRNMDKENKLILYKDEEGRVSVNTRFADEDVWLTQAQLVEIYQSSKSNISEHLTNIFADKELDQDAVVRKFRTTAADGKNYQVLHYNLDLIIALGYRVQSIMC